MQMDPHAAMDDLMFCGYQFSWVRLKVSLWGVENFLDIPFSFKYHAENCNFIGIGICEFYKYQAINLQYVKRWLGQISLVVYIGEVKF